MVGTGDREEKRNETEKIIFKESMTKISPNLLKNDHIFDLRYLNSKWDKCEVIHSQTAGLSSETMEAIIQCNGNFKVMKEEAK